MLCQQAVWLPPGQQSGPALQRVPCQEEAEAVAASLGGYGRECNQSCWGLGHHCGPLGTHGIYLGLFWVQCELGDRLSRARQRQQSACSWAVHCFTSLCCVHAPFTYCCHSQPGCAEPMLRAKCAGSGLPLQAVQTQCSAQAGLHTYAPPANVRSASALPLFCPASLSMLQSMTHMPGPLQSHMHCWVLTACVFRYRWHTTPAIGAVCWPESVLALGHLVRLGRRVCVCGALPLSALQCTNSSSTAGTPAGSV